METVLDKPDAHPVLTGLSWGGGDGWLISLPIAPKPIGDLQGEPTLTEYMDDHDRYAIYEDRFDPLRTDRRARRARKPEVSGQHQAKVRRREVVRRLADDLEELEAGVRMTYQPAVFEREWLRASLGPFYQGALISDVLARVRSGKESSVYCCQAHPSTGADLLAAKVYHPRRFRQLSNDAVYREGRAARGLLDLDGSGAREDERGGRSLEKGITYAERVAHVAWLVHEYTTLQRLYAAGASVPRPYASHDNALLMSYHGQLFQPAPILNEVKLTPAEARPLFEQIVVDVELMLALGIAHGDLSAYNVLLDGQRAVIIDLPQAIDVRGNPQARAIFTRDLTRLCQYFQAQGVKVDPQPIIRDLWRRYVE